MSHFVRYFLFAALFGTHFHLYAENLSGHSFLTAQPFSTISSDMTYSMIMDQYREKGSVLNKPQIQTTFVWGKSCDSAGLAEYFLFNNKQTLKVNEITLSASSDQDIIGMNFNILTDTGNYSSLISFHPEQTYWSAALSSRFALGERSWMTMQLPFLSVTNDLGFREKVIHPSAGSLASVAGFNGNLITAGTMIEAFRQRDMLYGKIDGPRTKKGCGDLSLTVGYDFDDRFDHYLAPYIGTTIPLSNKPTAEYMWEPVLGNNKHFGLFAGAYGHSQVYEKQDNIIWFTWSSKSEYLFSNLQKRSFDLYRGPWTRYLGMYRDNNDRISSKITLGTDGLKTFGINLMTQDAYVSPGFSNTSTLSLSYTGGKMQGTLGISSFMRESESIRLAHPWKKGPCVASFSDGSKSSSFRNIGNILFEDGEVSESLYIKEEDINLTSAASGNLLAGGVYATFGYYVPTSYAQLYEVGCSYETSRQNSAINRYALWAKFQLTF